MCYDCEVMDFDGDDMSFMMGPSNLNIYEHRFINTSTIVTIYKEVSTRNTIENTWKWRDLVMIY